jgi:CRP-like cAMP-binding protein
MPHLELLKDIPLFQGISSEEVARRGLHASPHSLFAGENLVTVGEPRARIWFLRSGWTQVRAHSPAGHASTVTIVGPGENLGCLSYFGLDTSPTTITALTDVSAVSVPTAAFERWLRSDAGAACKVLEAAGERLLESTLLKAINAERASVRLPLTLSWLYRKFGPDIPATRALLADLTGLRPETCSRALSELRRRRVLTVAPKHIRVLNPEKLDEIPRRR